MDHVRFIVYCFINHKMLYNYAVMDTGKEDSFSLINMHFSFAFGSTRMVVDNFAFEIPYKPNFVQRLN